MSNWVENLKNRVMKDLERQMVEDERLRNYEWVMENKAEVIDSFPGFWIAIQNQRTGIANHSLDALYRTLRIAGDLKPDMLFAYCDEFHFTLVASFGDENYGE